MIYNRYWLKFSSYYIRYINSDREMLGVCSSFSQNLVEVLNRLLFNYISLMMLSPVTNLNTNPDKLNPFKLCYIYIG